MNAEYLKTWLAELDRVLGNVRTCVKCGQSYRSHQKRLCDTCDTQAKEAGRDASEKAREKSIQEGRALTKLKPSKQKPELPQLTERQKQRELEAQEARELYRRHQKFGYVYLMCSGNGYHKIGISKNVVNRKWQIDREYPIKIELLHQFACNDYRRVERFLHEKYATKRVQYEWFKLDPEDVQWILSQKDHYLD